MKFDRVKAVRKIQKLAKELEIDEGTLGLHIANDTEVENLLVELKEIKRINEIDENAKRGEK